MSSDEALARQLSQEDASTMSMPNVDADAMLARQLSEEASGGAAGGGAQGHQYDGMVAMGAYGGASGSASGGGAAAGGSVMHDTAAPPSAGRTGDAAPTGGRRGKPVALPDDFLRVPGYRSPDGGGAGAAGAGNGEMTDAQLAMLLQNEMFLRELQQDPAMMDAMGYAPRRPGGATRQYPPAGQPRPAGSSSSSASSSGSSSSAWKAMSSMGDGMRRKLNDMAVSFSSRSASSGYASVESSAEPLTGGDEDETDAAESQAETLSRRSRPSTNSGSSSSSGSSMGGGRKKDR